MKLPRGLSGNEVSGLQPYPAMRDSGAQWLGKVPAHWEVRRLRMITSIINGATPSTNRDEYWDGEILWLTPEDLGALENRRITDSARKITTEGLESCGTSLASPNSIVISTRAPIGHLGILSSSGCSNQGCRLLVPNADTDSEYLYNVLEAAQSELQSLGQGATFTELSKIKLSNFRSPLPPLSEQAAIVRFLDHVDRRIRRYIRAKEKLIALLEEQKQVIVHQAVTGRIDVRTGRPYPAYKPSGVEWLGDVPAHWHIMPLKKVTLTRCDGPFGSGLKSSHYADRGVRVIRLQNIGHGEFNNTDSAYISFSHYATLGDHSVEAGDVLIAGLGDPNHPAGRACVAPVCIEPAMVKADCFRFRLNGDVVDSKFISLQLTATANAASAILSTGATRQRINLHSTSARLMALPSLSEQVTVVDFVDKAISEVNSSVARSQRQIGLVREYRTRLIADVVTGKVDVRSTAAELPELEPITDGGRLDAIQDEADFPITERSIAQEAGR